MNLALMFRQVRLSRQLFFALTGIPSLIVLFLFVYFNFFIREAVGDHLLVVNGSLAIVFLASAVASIFYVWKLSSRIIHIKEGVAGLSKGNLNHVPVEGRDEIADITKSLNTLADGLQQKADFTNEIGAGHLDAVYTPASEDDILGHSLLKMKDDLVALKAEDKKRIWATESLAKFADVLQSNRDLKTLSNEIIQNLVRTLEANQGAIFILNDDNKDDIHLEMKACYAYNRAKHFSRRIEPGDGILGQAFLEKGTIYLKEIPSEFIRITSGLGEATPRCLLIVPLKVTENIVGLVEIASFTPFEKFEIDFVEKLAENIAYSITSFRINENTSRLLTESRDQAEQMRAQEEELRLNQEEMQATQEEISRKYNVLFNQLTQLNYDSKFDQLKSINFTKKRSIEYYFDIIRSQIITFSENKTVVEGIKEFRSAFNKTKTTTSQAVMKEGLRKYYADDFLKKLNDNAPVAKAVSDYLPEEPIVVEMQHLYISSNPFPTGQKHLLNDAGDGSDYSRIHSVYHPLVRNFLEKFGYYDIFLIDHETGDMLYSVFKEVDFATSLLTGQYHKTNFGRVVKQAVESTDRNFVRLIDFEPYDPSYRAPASFIACPVFEADQKIGILVFQMPINKINQVLTGDNKWEEDGLGETGETVMVGADYKLRSISRGLIQNRERYLNRLASSGYSTEVINEVRKTNTSILLEEVKGESTTMALRGLTGTHMEEGSGGNVLTAYAPLQIEDVRWILLSSMAEEEASNKINQLRQAK